MQKLTTEELSAYEPTNNMVLVKPSRGENEYILPNGFKFFIDVQFEKEIHAPVTGTIISVPKNIYPGDFVQPGMQWDIDMEAQVNDYCVYSYLSATVALDPSFGQMIVCNGDLYLLIPYEEIFVVRRSGWTRVFKNQDFRIYETHIIPINGYNLVEPVEDAPTSIFLETESSKGPSTVFGKVAYLSKSLIRRYVDGDGQPDTENIKVGDIVTFDIGADLPVEYNLHASIDNKKMYYRIQRRNISGIIKPAIGK